MPATNPVEPIAETEDSPTPQPAASPVREQHWRKILENSTLIAAGRVIEQLNDVLQREDSSADAVAKVIMQDASLATRVLKVANGVVLNRGDSPLTLSEAVVKLGVAGLKSVCLSLVLLDSLRRHPALQQRINQCLSQSFHAGVQARMILGEDTDNDEAFIAAMLHNFGELMFWSSSINRNDKICQLINNGTVTPEQAVKRTLGVEFQEISRYFAENWQLSHLLIKSLADEPAQDDTVKAIRLAGEISRLIDQDWQSDDFLGSVRELAKLKKISPKEALVLIQEGVHEAVGVAREYAADGVIAFLEAKEDAIETFLSRGEKSDDTDNEEEKNKAATDKQNATQKNTDKTDAASTDDIPVITTEVTTEGAAEATEAEQGTEQEPPVLEPLSQDFQRQMDVLDGLWKLVEKQSDINTIFTMMSEGMYESLGMERIAICLTTPDRLKIIAKYVQGHSVSDWPKRFVAATDNPQGNIFAYVLNQGQPVISRKDDQSRIRLLITPDLNKRLGGINDMMAAPIFSGTRAVAMCYADRGNTGQPISDSQYQSFCRFAQQASAALTMLANKRKKG